MPTEPDADLCGVNILLEDNRLVAILVYQTSLDRAGQLQ